MAQFVREFLEDSQERLTRMADIYEAVRAGSPGEGRTLAAFRRDLHTMKGQGGSYGFASISLIAHRFEEYLVDFQEGDAWAVDGVQAYLDVLDRIVSDGHEPSTRDVKAILKELPSSPRHIVRNATVVWVCGARVIRHKVRRDLEAFGFSVISMHDPFDAMRYICKTHPEFVISSATLDGISGFDLIRILSDLKETAAIPSVLVTSFDPKHDQIRSLPPHVPIVKLSPFIGDELAHALSSLEFKRVNPEFNVRGD